MNRDDSLHILNTLYSDVNGYGISKQDRSILKKDSQNNTYGETDFMSFATMLSAVDVQNGEIFYDLGCGTGKAVFASALLEPFSQCIGIELFEGLYSNALSLKNTFDENIRPTLQEPVAKISFIHDDMFAVDVSRGSVFFVSATCFDEPMMVKLSKMVDSTHKGTRFIILSKELHHNSIGLLWTSVKKMSWGDAHVLVYRKNR